MMDKAVAKKKVDGAVAKTSNRAVGKAAATAIDKNIAGTKTQIAKAKSTATQKTPSAPPKSVGATVATPVAKR